jgi:hypothetical protein
MHCAVEDDRMNRFLPPGIVQPFDLRFSDDDFHVIAWFQGHPEYEAVEAMVRRRGQAPAAVRAILTRHDQTQVDHVNDEAAFADAQSLDGRLTVLRDVTVQEDGTPARPCLTVRFRSFADEDVVLRLHAAAPADAARGGLTDPGRHALTSSLPLMWRRRSGLAGEGTAVTVAGIPYPVRERMRMANGFVALDGFYSEGFAMGAMRAGRQAFEILEEPARIEAGSRWRYAARDGSEAHWVVTRMPSPRQVMIEGPRGERVFAGTDGHALTLDKVECLGCTLHLLPGGRFALDVADGRDLVTGTLSQAGATSIVLAPEEPGWAVARPVTIRLQRTGRQVQITSIVGREPLSARTAALQPQP